MGKLSVYNGSAWEELQAAVPQALVDDVGLAKSRATVAKDRIIDLSDYVDITGTSDGTSGLQAAINAAASGDAQALYLRSGATMKLSGTVDFPDTLRNKIRIVGDGPNGSQIVTTHAGAAFRLDPNTTPNTGSRRNQWRLENLHLTGPGKAVSGSVGLHLNNGLSGLLLNCYVTQFEIGVHVDGLGLANGAAAYYNNFLQLIAQNCGTGIKCSGQANSNMFFGGSARGSTIGVHLDGVNNITLDAMDIEGNTSIGLLVDAYQNHILGCRFENSTATYEIEFRDSTSGTTRGRKNVVASHFATFYPLSRIKSVSSITDNMILQHGLPIMGDIDSGSHNAGLQLSRSVSGNNKPLMLIDDTYSASGSPIGYQHRSARGTGTKWFRGVNSSDEERFVLGVTSAGRPYINMTNLDNLTTRIFQHNGAPEGYIAGNIGDLCIRTGTGGGLYVKESGDGTNTGWVKK